MDYLFFEKRGFQCHSVSHSFGGSIPAQTRYTATVFSYISSKVGSWYHSAGGIIPHPARNIATVLLFLSYNLGSHFIGGMIPL